MCTQLSPPSRSSRVPRFVSDIVFQWSSRHCFHFESDMFRASFGSSDKTLLQLHRTAKDDEKIEKEKRRKLRNASSILSFTGWPHYVFLVCLRCTYCTQIQTHCSRTILADARTRTPLVIFIIFFTSFPLIMRVTRFALLSR